MAEKENIYWKDAEKLSLVQFKPEGLSETETKVGWAARNALNATLVEAFKKDDTIIPELTTKEVKKPADYKKLDTDEEYRNKNLYPARAKLTVAPAFYTNDFTGKDGVEHKKGDPVMKRDGTQALNVRAEWLIDTDALTLNLTEKGDITGITARTGIAKGEKPTFVKQDELANSALSDDLKKLAGAIIDGGYVKDRETLRAENRSSSAKYQNEALNNLFFEAKSYFKENSETVTRTNKDGEEFQSPKTYVTDISDDFGEKLQFANVDSRDTIVEVGVATFGKEGEKEQALYVKATHFNGKGNPAERVYLNSIDDLNSLVEVPEIQAVVGKFMEDNQLVGSLYAVQQNMNADFKEAGIRENTYAIFSTSVYEKNQHTYENLTIVDEGMAVAKISRDASYKSPIFNVEAIDPNREEGQRAKTTLLTDKNIDKLIASADVADQLKAFVAENKVKTLDDVSKDR